MMNSSKWTCYNENKAPLNITVNTFIGTQDFHYQFYTFLRSMAPTVASSLTHTSYTDSKEYEESSVSLQTANKIIEQNAPVLIKVSLEYKGVTYSGNRVLALGYSYADGKYTFTNPAFTSLKNVCLEIMHNNLPRAAECDTVSMISFDVMSDAQIDALSKTGTFVYEGGVYQPEWNADTKLDKKTPGYDAVYGINHGDGVDYQAMIPTSTTPVTWNVVRYNGNKDIIVLDTPTADNAATSKKYVDNGFVKKQLPEEADVGTFVYAGSKQGGTWQDTWYELRTRSKAYTIPLYDVDGDLAARLEPTYNGSATSKQYVDKNSYAVVDIHFALPDMQSAETVTVAVPRKIGSLVVTYLPTSSAPETICYTNLQFEVGLNNENQWEVSMARATWWSAADSKMEFYEWSTPTKTAEPMPTTGQFQYDITEGV
jgi:hypothetical protein